MSKSIISQIKKSIAQLDTLLDAGQLKEAKRCDAIAEKSRLLTTLIQQEADELETEQGTRIKELEQQCVADARRITELEQQNATLRDRPLPQAIKIPDPDHAAVRQENARLNGLLKAIADSFTTEHERAMTAIRVIQRCSANAAKVFVPLLGFTYAEYARMLMTHKTKEQLNAVISAAQCEGPAVVFARAALALRDSEAACKTISRDPDGQRYVPDTRSPDVKLREAKESTRKSWIRPASSSADGLATRDAEENLRSQPRSIVGSPDAISHRERITPVFVGDLSSTPKEISGGLPFSPWIK